MATTTKNLVSVMDETEMMKKILETHAPDGSKSDTKLLLAAAEAIFNNLLTSGVDDTLNADAEKRMGLVLPIPSWLVCKVLKIIYEIVAKAFHCSKKSFEGTAADILLLLPTSDWEEKIVVVFAAYVVHCGEFSLLTQLRPISELAKSIATLKNIPENYYDDYVPAETRRKCHELVKAAFELAKLIVETNSLPAKYISDDAEPKAAASSQIPEAVLAMTTTLVACACLITGAPEQITGTEALGYLNLLEEKIIRHRTFFKTQLQLCNNHIAQNNPCCDDC